MLRVLLAKVTVFNEIEGIESILMSNHA